MISSNSLELKVISHGNALQSTNRFKLGLFGLNVDGACAITTIDGVFRPTWANVKG